MALGNLPGGLVVETLPPNAGGMGSIVGQGAKIPYACGQKDQVINQKQYDRAFNKAFKNGPHPPNLKRLHLSQAPFSFLRICHYLYQLHCYYSFFVVSLRCR